jgi:hypothetical protein
MPVATGFASTNMDAFKNSVALQVCFFRRLHADWRTDIEN